MPPTKVDYVIVFYFLTLTTKATFFYYIDAFWFIFSFGTLIYGLSQMRIYEKDLYVFTSFSFLFLIFILFRNFAINQLPSYYILSDIYYLIRYIFAAFVFCVVLRENATKLFVNVVYVLSIISLFCFTIQVVGGGDLLFGIGKTFMMYTPSVADFSQSFSNFLIFTYDHIHEYRNSGFAWEPGAFGSIIIISLLLNFLNNGFIFDRKCILLTIALITTFSTTTYLALAVLLFLVYRVRGGKWNMVFTPIILVMVLAFIYLPFLGDKITEIYRQDTVVLDDVEGLGHDIQYYIDNGGQVKLNRFSSALFLYKQFQEQLFFGVSNGYIKLDSKIYGVGLELFNTSNGIVDFVAKFGVFGILFVLFKIFQYTHTKLKRIEYSIYIIFIILVLNFGEPFLMLPITLMFLFFPNFNISAVNLEEKTGETNIEIGLSSEE